LGASTVTSDGDKSTQSCGDIHSARGVALLAILVRILKDQCPRELRYDIIETVQVLRVGRDALDLQRVHAVLSAGTGGAAASAALVAKDLQQVLDTPLSSVQQQAGSPLATGNIHDVLMRGL